MVNQQGQLFLIPSTLGNDDPETFLPKETLNVIHQLKYFIVENEKTARAFLKSCKIPTPQSELIIEELDKHDKHFDFNSLLKPAKEGHSIGLLSEAGCPAVADPGAFVVAAAHRNNIRVKPLVGPSSILLALMASGMEGQRFCFHGYLPIEKEMRIKTLQKLEKDAEIKKETQIFIETPYRNNPMIKDILSVCNNQTRICLAVSLNTAEENIRTLFVHEWKKQVPDLNKKPCVFLMY